MRNVAAGANPMGLKKGIEKAVAAAVETIKSQATDVDDKEHIAAVATISAADAVGRRGHRQRDRQGRQGRCGTVEESNTFGTELEFTEGMQFDKGYLSPYFVTDAERQEVVLEDAYILLNAARSARPGHAAGARTVMKSGRPLLIIAEDIEGEALATLVVEQDPRHVQLGRRQGPGLRRSSQGDAAGHGRPHRRSGHQRGGRSQARERHPRPARPAKRVIITKDNTTIVDGAGDTTTSHGRINQIKAEIDNTDSDWDREKLQERLGQAGRRRRRRSRSAPPPRWS